MDVYEIVDAFTDDKNPVTIITELIGKPKPAAYFLNYNSHGYALFKVDEKSM